MTKSKKVSRIFSVVLSLFLVVALAVPGFAIEQSEISGDVTHGRQLGCDATESYVLNQYITGIVP